MMPMSPPSTRRVVAEFRLGLLGHGMRGGRRDADEAVADHAIREPARGA